LLQPAPGPAGHDPGFSSDWDCATARGGHNSSFTSHRPPVARCLSCGYRTLDGILGRTSATHRHPFTTFTPGDGQLRRVARHRR
jgi:hypothetical protein